jgi:hypothetical protein
LPKPKWPEFEPVNQTLPERTHQFAQLALIFNIDTIYIKSFYENKEEKILRNTPNVTRPGPLAFGLKPSTLSFSVGSDLKKGKCERYKMSKKTLNNFMQASAVTLKIYALFFLQDILPMVNELYSYLRKMTVHN